MYRDIANVISQWLLKVIIDNFMYKENKPGYTGVNIYLPHETYSLPASTQMEMCPTINIFLKSFM